MKKNGQERSDKKRRGSHRAKASEASWTFLCSAAREASCCILHISQIPHNPTTQARKETKKNGRERGDTRARGGRGGSLTGQKPQKPLGLFCAQRRGQPLV